MAETARCDVVALATRSPPDTRNTRTPALARRQGGVTGENEIDVGISPPQAPGLEV